MQGNDLNDLLGKLLQTMVEGQASQTGRRPTTPARPASSPPPGQTPPSTQAPPAPMSDPWRSPAPPGGDSPGNGGSFNRGQAPANRMSAGAPNAGPIVSAEVVDAEPVTGDDVADYVSRHLDSRRVTERASHLGEKVALADDELDAHQRQLFGGGPRSRLADSSTAGKTSGESPHVEYAAESSASRIIGDGLRSPAELRRAFVLGEVLRRPEWEDD